jgi:hypothetical protein
MLQSTVPNDAPIFHIPTSQYGEDLWILKGKTLPSLKIITRVKNNLDSNTWTIAKKDIGTLVNWSLYGL